MPLPLIPLGYAAAALLAAYGGKKAYDKAGRAQEVLQDLKKAAGATADTAQVAADAAMQAQAGAPQKIDKLVDSATEFTNSLHDRAHRITEAVLPVGAAVLGAWAAVSAFYVGLMAGFGIHFLRLIDKASLFSELVFYATIVSALRAPAALVAALTGYGTGEETPEWMAPAVLVTTFLVVPFVLLNSFYALLFIIAGTVLWLLSRLCLQAVDRAFYAVCALMFGFLYAETLTLQRPDTKVIFTDSNAARITLLMSTSRGLIGLDESRQMAQFAWSSIASVSVEQGPTKTGWLHELLKNWRTAFEVNAARTID